MKSVLGKRQFRGWRSAQHGSGAVDAVLGLVGDIFIDRANPSAVFEDVVEELHAVDLLFGNLEGVYADDPHFAPTAGLPVYAAPTNAVALGPAGFRVMSMANNHIGDCGHSAMLQTQRLLKEQGIATCGVGIDLDHARSPAVAFAGPYRVAVLAFASVFPHGYEARPGFPGLSAIRTRDYFESTVVNHHLPGTIPIIRTEEYAEDVSAMQAALAKARETADIVVASFHWGDWTRAAHITEHERRLARLAIDAGADVVAGHHHHALRGLEFYQERPIFYGLGHFVFDLPNLISRARAIARDDNLMPQVPDDDETTYGLAPRKGWPYLPMHPDMRLSMLAWVQIRDGRPDGVGFVPCRLQPDGRIRPFDPESVEGASVVDFVRSVCKREALPVVIEPTSGINVGRFRTARIRAVDEGNFCN